jgi:DNA-binding LytR/AlgR family response regulator
MRVLIVEDEHLASQKLKQLLLKIDDSIQILDMLESVSATINWISNNPPPDLIFMDIQLDDGVCFEIFNAVEVNTPVIFTTAYDQYAIKAFKVNSVDYLLKPISHDDLTSALKKFNLTYQQAYYQKEKINILYDQLVKKDYKSRFFVKVGTHFFSISTEDIACFYIRERSTFIKSKVGKNFDIDFSLDQVQHMVDPDHFFRINRNYIVNLDSITDIISYSTNRLKLKLKNFEHLEDLIVSREKTSDFKQWLDK